MSIHLPHDHAPPGLDMGSFVALDAVEFRNGYATFLQGLSGTLPHDPDFPKEYQEALSCEMRPLADTPLMRATYAASKRFTDEAKRLSFMFRLQLVMPIAMGERKYAKYRNDEAGTMHLALMSAVAAMPFNVRHTRKALRTTLDAALRNILAAFKQLEKEEQQSHRPEETMH
jgi:hypothetical protein